MNDTLIQKIQSTQRCIQRSRDIYNHYQQDFLKNYDAQDAAVLNLIRVCENSIDLANYLIKRDKLGIPASSAESFELLVRDQRISSQLGSKLAAMVGFRNIAVHQYRRLNYLIVIDIIEYRLDDVITFLDSIMELEGPSPSGELPRP